MRKHTCAVVGYVLLVLLFNHMLVANITSHIIGGFDSWSMIWMIWWAKTSIIDLHSNPFFTDMLFHPMGINMVGGLDNYVTVVVAIPVYMVTGNLVFSYNIIVLSILAFSGFTMYLLAFYLTRHFHASFVAGFIFAFNPFMINEVVSGHLNIISVEWMPMFFIFFLKLFREGGLRNIFFASVFFVLTTTSCWYYGLYLVLAFLLFVDYRFFRNELSKKYFWNLIVFILLAALMTLTVLYPALNWYISERGLTSTIPSHKTYAADLADFIIPSIYHPVLGAYTTDLFFSIHEIYPRAIIYPGIIVMLLVIVGLRRIAWEHTGFWAILALFFSVLALGPELKYFGVSSGLPMPEIILNVIPPYSMLHVPARMMVFVMLSLSVISAFSLRRVWDKSRFVFFLICAFLVLDYIPFTPHMSYAGASEFFGSIGEFVGEDDAVLNLPVEVTPPKFNYYQTIYGRKHVGGYVTWTTTSEEHIGFFRDSLLFQAYSMSNKDNVLDDDFLFEGIRFLNDNDIRLIIIHKRVYRDYYSPLVDLNIDDVGSLRELDENQTMHYRRVTEEHLGLKPVFEDDQIITYTVPFD